MGTQTEVANIKNFLDQQQMGDKQNFWVNVRRYDESNQK